MAEYYLTNIRNTRHNHEYRVYSADQSMYYGLVFTDNSQIRKWIARPAGVVDDSQDTPGFPNKNRAAAHIFKMGGVNVDDLLRVDVKSDGHGNRIVSPQKVVVDKDLMADGKSGTGTLEFSEKKGILKVDPR